MNFDTATKEKNAARLKNKETVIKEQKQVHENKDLRFSQQWL